MAEIDLLYLHNLRFRKMYLRYIIFYVDPAQPSKFFQKLSANFCLRVAHQLRGMNTRK